MKHKPNQGKKRSKQNNELSPCYQKRNVDDKTTMVDDKTISQKSILENTIPSQTESYETEYKTNQKKKIVKRQIKISPCLRPWQNNFAKINFEKRHNIRKRKETAMRLNMKQIWIKINQLHLKEKMQWGTVQQR